MKTNPKTCGTCKYRDNELFRAVKKSVCEHRRNEAGLHIEVKEKDQPCGWYQAREC